MADGEGVITAPKSSQFELVTPVETVMARRLRDGAIAVAIACFLLWLYKPFSANLFNPTDSGDAAYNAVRVLDGRTLASNLGRQYGPVQYYARALFFALFGTNLSVMYKEFVAMSALFVAGTYWVLRGSAPRRPALLLTAFVGTLAIFPLGSQGVMYLAMLVAVGCMTRYAYERRSGWLIGAGVAIGVIIGAQWDIGLLILLLFFLTVASMPALHRGLHETTVPLSRRSLGLHLLFLLGPAALVAFALYAPALFADPGSLVRGMALHQGIGAYQALPWPPLPSIRAVLHGELTFPQFLDGAMSACPAYAFFVLAPVNALAIFIALSAGLPERPRLSLLLHTLLTTCIAAFILFSHFSRPDPAHTLPMTLFMLISLALPLWVLAQLRAIAPVGSTLLRWFISLAILVIAVPALLAGIQGIASQWNQSLPAGTLTAPRVAGAATDPATATNYDALITYIKEHTTPDEPIFSGSTRHDLLAGNDVLLYFAAERQAGVRDYSMMPGITTRRDVQQRIVDDLQRNNVALIVLSDNGIPQEPNRSRESSGVTLLDDYIAANYRIVQQFGSYFVLAPQATVAAPCGSTAVAGTSGYVDAAYDPRTNANTTPHSGEFRIGGWAVAPQGAPPVKRVEVHVNNQLVYPVIQCIPRPDVAALYGESARYSGWEVTVDARGITQTGPIDVVAEVIDAAGNRTRIPTVGGFQFGIMP